jgi:hypothetical protein
MLQNTQAEPRRKLDPLQVATSVLLVSFALGAALIYALAKVAAKSPSPLCVANIKQICLGAQIWSYDHKSQTLPTNFLTFSNEMNSPVILHCRADNKHPRLTTWSAFKESDASYRLATGAVRVNTTQEFVRCPIHGHTGLANGEVLMGTNR